VGRISVFAVLGDGMFNRLASQVVLQLCRSRWNPIHEEHQVKRLCRARLIGELARHGEAVGTVEGKQFRREAMGGFKKRQLDGDTKINNAVAQHIHCATVIELSCKPLGKASLCGIYIVTAN
ncbi:MAG TPA: hypothetical protein VFV38_21080, partial [Ktedonobacteraceae bacterium]|nr:hypothetical protein [Ktedonobacteraceae bacterium]